VLTTLAEAVHSVADTSNQILLLLGMRLSRKKPTERHQFGRAVEAYFWPFVVSIMLFTVGGVFAIYEGVHKLAELRTVAAGLSAEDVAHTDNFWNYVVLSLALLFEGYSCTIAILEFRKMKGDVPTAVALTETKDPTVPVVIMEDIAALIGLLLALGGVGLSDLTGWTGWDGIASLLIGGLLCAVAVFLARDIHSLILGESASRSDQARIREIAEGVAGVREVTQLLTLHRGPSDVLVAMKVDFERGLAVGRVEDLVNTIERNIRADLEQMQHIFIEPDAAYEHDLDSDHPSPTESESE
jgi:cation diffusion facilitator family transporter